MTDQKNERSPILKGAAWVSSSRFFVRFFGLFSTVILARLLVPADFGLVAVASSIIGFLEALSSLNFGQALIRFQDADDDDYSTAWTLNICRGVSLCLILLIISFPLSIILDDDRLFLIVIVISAIPFLGGLENPRWIIFEKTLRFDVFFKIMVGTKFAGVLMTVSMAFLWRTYWALIAGMIFSDLIRITLTHCYAQGKLRLTVKSWRKLFSFTGWLTGTEMLTALTNRLDPIILAAFASPHIVGILHIARDLSNMTFNEFTIPLRRVIFPELSRYSQSSTKFLYAYKQAVSGLFLLLSPICVGFILTIPDFIPLVLGDKWQEVIFPVQLITFALFFSIVGQLAHAAAMAKGEPQLIFYQGLVVTPIKLLVFFFGVKWYGLYGAVYAICFELILSTLIRLYISKKVTNLNFFQHIFLLRNSFIPLVLMCLMVYLTSYYVTIGQVGSFFHLVRLIAMVLIGAAAYGGSCLFIWKINGRPAGPEAALVNYFLSFFNTRVKQE